MMLCLVPEEWMGSLERMVSNHQIQMHFASCPSSVTEESLKLYTALYPSILIVCDTSRAPRSVVDSTVVGESVIGVFPAKDINAFKQYVLGVAGNPAHRRYAVLSEWDDHYEDLGKQMVKSLKTYLSEHHQQKNIRQVCHWRDRTYNQHDLLKKFKSPVKVTGYFGHGADEGLLAYGGIYREHVDELNANFPFGVFLAMSCSTLKTPRSGRSFGVHCVAHQLAKAYLGSHDSVKTRDNTALIETMLWVFENNYPKSVRELIFSLDHILKTEKNKTALKAWKTYRLIGSPETVIA